LTVNEKRKEKSLGQLDIQVIELIADDAETGAATAAAKMGSTGIRKWLEERQGE
jgi:phosphopantetheine adenylyltransferase